MKQGLLRTLTAAPLALALSALAADAPSTTAPSLAQPPQTNLVTTNYVLSGPVADSLQHESAWKKSKRVLNLFNPLAKTDTNAAAAGTDRARSWPPPSGDSAFPDAVNHEAGSELVHVAHVAHTNAPGGSSTNQP